MEKIAIWIAAVALIVTTINVILVFIDLWSRSGKKLNVYLIFRQQETPRLLKNKFLLQVSNCKASNICVEEISYILSDKNNGPIEKIVIPHADPNMPCLLNGYESKLLPIQLFVTASDIWNCRKDILYIRILTSKGVFFLRNKRICFVKSIFVKSARISYLEKLIARAKTYD